MPAKVTLAIRCTAAPDKDKDNADNRAYKPPTNVLKEGGSKDDSKKEEEEDNSNDNGTSNGTSNSKDKARCKPSNSGLRYKADSGQSSRPPLPIRTLLEDKEDSEDYSKVIEVLKQHIKSHKRVIAS
ncbi:hypothetical protein P8C59_003120 [Phyllachora maydis]|uniref:Uncharacterized protein n=1 Tax=Phyllachora maydis TaxID=1825666 RepID=A0AAD9HZT5_9PEZI|nr:hypothetical protein P8C59_003120 [Phyllachora maydis]